MVASSILLGGKLLVAKSLTFKAMSLSRLLLSRAGITDKLLASMFNDMITRPAHGTEMESAYFAIYSMRGFATARLMSSVAFR